MFGLKKKGIWTPEDRRQYQQAIEAKVKETEAWAIAEFTAKKAAAREAAALDCTKRTRSLVHALQPFGGYGGVCPKCGGTCLDTRLCFHPSHTYECVKAHCRFSGRLNDLGEVLSSWSRGVGFFYAEPSKPDQHIGQSFEYLQYTCLCGYDGMLENVKGGSVAQRAQ